MSDSLIPSFLVSDVSESLRSLTKNEQPWAIRSGRSEEMSNCEQIAQVAHQKWANEWTATFMSKSENRWANSQPWLIGTYYLFDLRIFIELIDTYGWNWSMQFYWTDLYILLNLIRAYLLSCYIPTWSFKFFLDMVREDTVVAIPECMFVVSPQSK